LLFPRRETEENIKNVNEMRDPTKEGIKNGNKTKETIQNGEYREQCQSKRTPEINAVGIGENKEEEEEEKEEEIERKYKKENGM
jgi:hypothetical protein